MISSILSRHVPVNKLMLAAFICILVLMPSIDACQQLQLKSLKRVQTSVTSKDKESLFANSGSQQFGGFGRSDQNSAGNPSTLSIMLGVGTIFQYKLDNVAFNVFNETVEIPSESLQFPCFRDQILSFQLSDITNPSKIEEQVYTALNQLDCDKLQRGTNTVQVSLYTNTSVTDEVSVTVNSLTSTSFVFGNNDTSKKALYTYEFGFEVGRFCTSYQWNKDKLKQSTQIISSRYEARILGEEYVNALMKNQETVYYVPKFIRNNQVITVQNPIVFNQTFNDTDLLNRALYNMVPSDVAENQRNVWPSISRAGGSTLLQANGPTSSAPPAEDMNMWYGLIAFLGLLLTITGAMIAKSSA